MTDLHPVDDLLLALALDDVDDVDDVDDTKRESTLKHLATCHRCRNEYDALSATIEQTLAAAPSVEPGPGFDGRVLTAMGFDESAVAPAERRPRRGWQRWQLVAASVVVGLGLGAGATVALSQVNDSSRTTLAQNSSYLETADGEHVGTVTRSFVNGEKVLVVTVTSGRVGMNYLCLLRLEGGEQAAIATWVLGSERGETWVVKAPAKPVAEVVLVANGGAGPVWSTARL